MAEVPPFEPFPELGFVDLLESAPDAIIIVDGHGRISVANHQTEQLLGYSRDELIGQPIEVLLPERFRGGHHPAGCLSHGGG